MKWIETSLSSNKPVTTDNNEMLLKDLWSWLLKTNSWDTTYSKSMRTILKKPLEKDMCMQTLGKANRLPMIKNILTKISMEVQFNQVILIL